MKSNWRLVVSAMYGRNFKPQTFTDIKTPTKLFVAHVFRSHNTIRNFEMKEKLEDAILNSLKDLIKHDGELFGFKINEKAEENGRKLHEVCINHILSIHLSNHIIPLLQERKQPYFTDIEFNRNGEKEKAVIIDGEDQVVRPDIIIHNRKEGHEKSNFLIVECKKDGCSKKDYNYDCVRIRSLMKSKDYEYEYGLMVLYKEAASVDAKFFWHNQAGIASKTLNC